MNTARVHISETGLYDYHKEAYGFKGRHYKDWWTEEEMNAEYARLEAIVLEEIELRKEWEAAGYTAFRKKLKEVMNICSCTWDRALEYMADPEFPDVEDVLREFRISYAKQKEIINLYCEVLRQREAA